jgi:hypothetical protein
MGSCSIEDENGITIYNDKVDEFTQTLANLSYRDAFDSAAVIDGINIPNEV